MTQENKELLLKDLCARLPYKTRCKYYDVYENSFNEGEICGFERGDRIDIGGMCICVEDIKPYLFPLSSMTEGQKEEYADLQQRVIYNGKGVVNLDVAKYVGWCYRNHIDINNLIPMGLAIDATGLNIY